MDTSERYRELTHERLGEQFEQSLSTYDTQRRVEVLVDEFLNRSGDVADKRALDAGCGLGFFSERLVQYGANVTAVDIGPSLVEQTRARAGCDAQVADCLALTDAFGPSTFDVVVSSECIEHTRDPLAAVSQMVAVLKPGGLLALSTPNILWKPVVDVATRLRLRPFDGYENFSSWRGLRNAIEALDCTIVSEKGLHLFPFQLPLRTVSRWCDAQLQILRPLMINICILARRNKES